MKITATFNKTIYILIFCISTLSLAQTIITEKFSSGKMYWGAFNAEKKEIVGNLDFRANVINIEKSYDSSRTYYYKITSTDTSGKTSTLKFYGIVNQPEHFIDDNNLEYIILENNEQINILCLKVLPKGENLYLYITIVDIKE